MFSFTDGVNEIADLKVGMKLPGIVTNITNFGAFVDLGVHQDGLVHTSQIADKFVANANEVVKVHQKVEVTVVEVDVVRKRISLSMKKEVGAKPKQDHKGSGDRSKGSGARSFAKPDQHKKPVAKPQHKAGQKEKALPEGDLQLKLEALKNMFK